MTKPKKTSIPAKVASEVEHLSDLKCCVCQKRGEHIHHIDGDNSNHKIDNLAFLCFEHHKEASVKGGLTRKLSAGAIKKYRNAWYKKVEAQREYHPPINDPIKRLTEADLLVAALNANIILEVEKIKVEYSRSKSDNKIDIIDKLWPYITFNNITVSKQVLSFLVDVSYQTRFDKSENTAWAIYVYMLEFFVPHDDKRRIKELNDLGRTAAYIGFNVAYDGAIHCRNLAVYAHGLEILKYIHDQAIFHKLPAVEKEVLQQFSSLDSTLHRPERNDLRNAIKLLNLWRESLDKRGGVISKLSYDMSKLIYPEKKK